MNTTKLKQKQLTDLVQDLLAAEKFDEADQLLRENAALLPDTLETQPFQGSGRP